jgi:hypothetical protein
MDPSLTEWQTIKSKVFDYAPSFASVQIDKLLLSDNIEYRYYILPAYAWEKMKAYG